MKRINLEFIELIGKSNYNLIIENGFFCPIPTSAIGINIRSYLNIDEIDYLAIDIEDNIK